MAMKAMKLAKAAAPPKSTAMKAAKAAAPPKSTAMKAAKAAKVAAPPAAMKKQATKFKHTTWTYVNVSKFPWRPEEELDPMVGIK